MKEASFLLLRTFSVKAVFLPSLGDSLLFSFSPVSGVSSQEAGQTLIEASRMNSHVTVDILYVQADLSVKSAPGGHLPEKELGLIIQS